MKEYKELVTTVLRTTEARSQMVVNYLKDVSTMLAIISAARTGNITQHFQTERSIPKLIFAFDHIKYACYNSFQQAFGVVLAKPTDLHETFSYPMTSLPLSIASIIKIKNKSKKKIPVVGYEADLENTEKILHRTFRKAVYNQLLPYFAVWKGKMN